VFPSVFLASPALYAHRWTLFKGCLLPRFQPPSPYLPRDDGRSLSESCVVCAFFFTYALQFQPRSPLLLKLPFNTYKDLVFG
jgi:hypothetical protein